jgi:hypothetical protein
MSRKFQIVIFDDIGLYGFFRYNKQWWRKTGRFCATNSTAYVHGQSAKPQMFQATKWVGSPAEK